MMNTNNKIVYTDILVIGSGIAGLNFALHSSKYADITIITKETIEESNTFYAQGGLAGVFSEQDSFEKHIEDTLRVGEGLCDKKVVEFVIRNAPNEINNLSSLGVRFDGEHGKFSLSKESAHSMPRIVHSRDSTGRHIEETLVNLVKKQKSINIIEKCIAFELIVNNGVCLAVITLDLQNNRVIQIISKAVILATGGIGQIYKYTTNPTIATGDGIAMAYNSGVTLSDMEFIQFHPTRFALDNFLISETVRGEGGILTNLNGERFMLKYSKDAELSPRNIVARAIFQEMQEKKSDFVYLDISHRDTEYIIKRFPNIYKKCKEKGINITKELIPVFPASHYLCGGVVTNINAETNINGLYAIGETACTGLHGADRLASNSLTEALVFSSQASICVRDYIKKLNENSHTKVRKFPIHKIVHCPESSDVERLSNKRSIEDIRLSLQELMWKNVGIIRSISGLKIALESVSTLEKKFKKLTQRKISREIIEVGNMLTCARIIIISALNRKESRGTHFMSDSFTSKRDD